MRKTKEINIEEIARLAGVSTATVSRVINNKPSVSEKTREKVLEMMQGTGYALNDRQRRSHFGEEPSSTIAVLLPDISNPFNGVVVEGIRKAAKQHDFTITLILAKETGVGMDYYEEKLCDTHIAGIISLSAFPSLEIALQIKNRWPLVMCSEYLETDLISSVGIDDVKAAEQATSFLLQSGRKKIALINSSLENKYARDREAGYKRALIKAGYEFNDDFIIHLSTVSYHLALSQLIYLFTKKPNIDAIFACSDIFAAAAIEAAKKVGRKVPRDIAIIGFDNIDLAVMTSPSLTTVGQPSFEIGYQSCEILIEHIQKPYIEPKNITLFTDFIIREST